MSAHEATPNAPDFSVPASAPASVTTPASGTATAETPAQPVYGYGEGMLLPLEDYPQVDHLITQDNTPVDNLYAEKQQRLLTEALFSSWAGPGEGRPFVVMANVGLFFTPKNPALVPDCMLSGDVVFPGDIRLKKYHSYFLWEYGKVPDVVVEIVSDRSGGEDTTKLRKYARHRIPYYVIYDPYNCLKSGLLRFFELRGSEYEARSESFFPAVQLGLTLWDGVFEEVNEQWLRWCDHEGRVIPTGRERADEERQRADEQRQRADEERQRAEIALQRVQEERQRAEQAEQRATGQDERLKRLEAQLRALGIEPGQ